MDSEFQVLVQELKLISTIFDTLTRGEKIRYFRPDQAASLTQRLTTVVAKLEALPNSQSFLGSISGKRNCREDSMVGHDAHITMCSSDDQGKMRAGNVTMGSATGIYSRKKVLKPSSIKVKSIPREVPPSDKLVVSKEVERAIACSLYNVLESTVTLLRASSASVFVRDGEEMVSIANVATRLSFPPQMVRHRCLGSLDAEVLGSGIALNQSANDASQLSSLLIFPVFPLKSAQGPRERTIATIHVENKDQGTQPFDSLDESILFLASCLIGEIMARIPSFEWLKSFYDPATQHIVAPFMPRKGTSLPSLLKSSTSTGVPTKMLNKIEDFSAEVLIKRDKGDGASKSPIPGLAQMPTLREVRVYIDNLQDSWKKGVTSTVHVTEEDRQTTMELKQVRRQLRETQTRLDTAVERLRLYELDGGDYQREYRSIKTELDAYLRKRDHVEF